MLRRRKFFQGRRIRGADVKDIAWLDASGPRDDRRGVELARRPPLGVRLDGDAIDEVDERGERIVGDTLLCCSTRTRRTVPFALPATRRRALGNADRHGRSVAGAEALRAGDRYQLQGRSMAVLSLNCRTKRGGVRLGTDGVEAVVRACAARRARGFGGAGPQGSKARRQRTDDGAATAQTRGRRRADLDGGREHVVEGGPPRSHAAGASSSRACTRNGRGTVSHQADGGRMVVVVGADIHADGHDKLGGRCTIARGSGWRKPPMRARQRPLAGDVRRRALGGYEYRRRLDRSASARWRHELSKKFGAGQDVTSELLEGRARSSAKRGARGVRPADAALLEEIAAALATRSIAQPERVSAASPSRVEETMARYARPRRATRYAPRAAGHRRAGTGAVRRVVRDVPALGGHRPERSGTFREAAGAAALRRLDGLRRGLPAADPSDRPQHPQRAEQHARRGPAIPAARGRSAPAGGTRAVEPGARHARRLRSLRRSRARLGSRSRSISPSRRRPIIPRCASIPSGSGSGPTARSKYAENPPKKYQDIYPFDFESSDWQALWTELRDVIEFWIAHGVKIFRVDNPHTKPFAFWEWAHRRHQARSIPIRSSSRRRSPARR